MEEGTIDLIVTSPPYGVGIDYDSWDDDNTLKNIKYLRRVG